MSSVDSGAAHVPDQRAEHLGHPAAPRRRVHAPDHPIGEQLAPARDRVGEPRDARTVQHAVEAPQIERRDVDVGDLHRRNDHPISGNAQERS
jgi:hypothetical protein